MQRKLLVHKANKGVALGGLTLKVSMKATNKSRDQHVRSKPQDSVFSASQPDTVIKGGMMVQADSPKPGTTKGLVARKLCHSVSVENSPIDCVRGKVDDGPRKEKVAGQAQATPTVII